MMKPKKMQLALLGRKGNAYNIFLGNPEGMCPLGRHRRRWVYNILEG
jgi:hypothetical protein